APETLQGRPYDRATLPQRREVWLVVAPSQKTRAAAPVTSAVYGYAPHDRGDETNRPTPHGPHPFDGGGGGRNGGGDKNSESEFYENTSGTRPCRNLKRTRSQKLHGGPVGPGGRCLPQRRKGFRRGKSLSPHGLSAASRDRGRRH